MHSGNGTLSNQRIADAACPYHLPWAAARGDTRVERKDVVRHGDKHLIDDKLLDDDGEQSHREDTLRCIET